jgi:hypothetical protein
MFVNHFTGTNRTAMADRKSVRTPARRANSLFAFQRLDPAIPYSPFPDSTRITLAAPGGDFAGLEVAAGPGASVEMLLDAPSGCCAYLWGLPAHPDVCKAELLRWIVDQVNTGHHTSLRQLIGMFVVLIDDRRNRRVRVISDVGGLRPWFIGSFKGRLVCGSHVWAIHDAGLNGGGVNYDALASWVRHAYDNTARSLFSDYAEIGCGVVGTWENGKYSESPYATYTGAQHKTPRAELLEGIHHRMSRAFNALTRDLDHVTISLSGGYDSRYLAALASRCGHLKVEAFCVRDDETESRAAAMVCEALGLPLKILHTDGSRWNMYDEPFLFMPNGFPITRQSTWLAARQRPGVPCLNGYMGDGIIRGILDRYKKKAEEEYGADLPIAYQHAQTLDYTEARFDLMDEQILQRCDVRTLRNHRNNLEHWSSTDHRLFGIGTFVKQRQYLGNNFRQHLDIAEGLCPFMNFDLIEYRFQHHWSCFGYDTYAQLFQTFLPELGSIPHAAKLTPQARPMPRHKASHCTRTWAFRGLKVMADGDALPFLSRRKTIPRLLGAFLGRTDLEVAARFVYRLLLLDERLRKSGVAFDWNDL